MWGVLLTWLALPLLRVLAGARHQPPKRILLIQAAKIGDAICTSPVLRELRFGLPDAHITVLASPVAAPLFRHDPHATSVMAVDSSEWRGFGAKWRLARRLRRECFDWVVCCNGGSIWPTVTTWAGIPVRAGLRPNFSGRSQQLAQGLWTVSVPHRGDRLIVDTYFDLLRGLGLSPVRSDKEVFAAPGANDRISGLLAVASSRIGLAVGAANKLKELPDDTLREIAAGILATLPATTVVLLGTAADRHRALAIRDKIAPDLRSRIVDACGQVALEDLPALIARLNGFVGVDSALTYMADALGIPLVSVAGPCNMRETRPIGKDAIIIQRQLPCLPCAHIFRTPNTCRVGTLACIRDITATEVVTAICEAMGPRQP